MSLELSIKHLAIAIESLVTILLEQAPEELKERVTRLAAQEAKEEASASAAQDSKVVPIQPRKKAGKAKAAEPEAPAEENPNAVTISQVRELMKTVDRKYGRNVVMAILAKYEVTRLGDVDPGQYILLKRDLENAGE